MINDRHRRKIVKEEEVVFLEYFSLQNEAKESRKKFAKCDIKSKRKKKKMKGMRNKSKGSKKGANERHSTL